MRSPSRYLGTVAYTCSLYCHRRRFEFSKKATVAPLGVVAAFRAAKSPPARAIGTGGVRYRACLETRRRAVHKSSKSTQSRKKLCTFRCVTPDDVGTMAAGAAGSKGRPHASRRPCAPEKTTQQIYCGSRGKCNPCVDLNIAFTQKGSRVPCRAPWAFSTATLWPSRVGARAREPNQCSKPPCADRTARLHAAFLS